MKVKPLPISFHNEVIGCVETVPNTNMLRCQIHQPKFYVCRMIGIKFWITVLEPTKKISSVDHDCSWHILRHRKSLPPG